MATLSVAPLTKHQRTMLEGRKRREVVRNGPYTFLVVGYLNSLDPSHVLKSYRYCDAICNGMEFLGVLRGEVLPYGLVIQRTHQKTKEIRLYYIIGQFAEELPQDVDWTRF